MSIQYAGKHAPHHVITSTKPYNPRWETERIHSEKLIEITTASPCMGILRLEPWRVLLPDIHESLAIKTADTRDATPRFRAAYCLEHHGSSTRTYGLTSQKTAQLTMLVTLRYCAFNLYLTAFNFVFVPTVRCLH